MPGRRSIQDFDPGVIAAGIPFGPVVLRTPSASNLTASSSVVWDSWVVPAAFLPDAGGNVLHLAEVGSSLFAIGNGSTGGLTFIIKSLQSGLTLATVTYVQSTTTLAQTSDVRDAGKRGVGVKAGDTLQLLVTAIPGSASTAATGLVARLLFNCFGVRG